MKIKIAFLLFSIVSVTSGQLFAADMSDAKKKDIEELVSLLAQTKVFNQIVTSELLKNMPALRSKYPGSTDDDISRVVRQEVTGTVLIVWINLYDRHFTESEIKETLAFYKSSAGRKMDAEMPQIMQELPKEMQAAFPGLERRVNAALSNVKGPEAK